MPIQPVAIDHSTPHLEVAKKLTTSQALAERVDLAQADLESTLPYPDGSFDDVWSADVITPDDFADIPSVVSELFRVLKPRGSLSLFYGNWLQQQLPKTSTLPFSPEVKGGPCQYRLH